MCRVSVFLLLLVIMSGCATNYSSYKQRFNYIIVDDLPISKSVKHEGEGIDVSEFDYIYYNIFDSRNIFSSIVGMSDQENSYIEGRFKTLFIPFLFRSDRFVGVEVTLTPLKMKH